MAWKAWGSHDPAAAPPSGGPWPPCSLRSHPWEMTQIEMLLVLLTASSSGMWGAPGGFSASTSPSDA